MASTAAGGSAARGGLNPPYPNPSGDGGPKLRSPPGNGNKPIAPADVTNTGKPNAARSIAVPDLVKENAKLLTLLDEKTVEIYKLRLALQASKQQNLHIARTNSQMLVEINAGKDRIKILQHELSCATALLKVKGSELDVSKRNKNAANGLQKGVKSQVLKGTASIVIGVDSVTSGVEHHLVESQSAISSNTVCQEPPQDGKQKRMPQRRSLRLNQGSCEIGGVSQNTLHEDTVAPLAPSTLSVQKQYGQTTGKHTEKSLQNESSATVHEIVMASEFKINEQPQKTNLKEIQEACSRKSFGDNDPHKIGDNAFNRRQSHLTGSQSSLSFNTVDPPEPLEDNAIKPNIDDEELGSLLLNWIDNSECHSPIRKLHANLFDFDILPHYRSGSLCFLVEHQMTKSNSSQIKRTFGDHKWIYSTVEKGGEVIQKTIYRYQKKSKNVNTIRLEEFSKVGGPKEKVLWKFIFREVDKRKKRKAPPWTEVKEMKVNLAETFAGKEDRIQEVEATYCQAICNDITQPKPSKKQKNEPSVVDPWSASTRNTLLETVNGDLRALPGYHKSNKVYYGKVPLTSSLNVLRNKVIELGGRKYQIKGSSGAGAFAKVYKATVDGNTEEMVALKIQNPSFALEFYMYCQLNLRISDIERPSFGYAHEMHIFSDVSVLVCDYLPYGTLLDVINSHFGVGRYMDEVLCMYYTIEMLNMLETLHSVGIIHGDFKPDNILVCYPSGEITEDTFRSEKRDEKNQGLCLVDWGRGIDLNLFPSPTEFHGDCGTSGFRCTEMQEHRNWTYQVDTYGLCVVVHMMLHGAGMSVVKEPRIGGGYEYRPKKPFKRYWNVDLWQKLFSTLLNPPSNDSDSDVAALRSLRASFREYMCSNRQLVGKLNQLLAKRKASLCSS